jgi:hypothetical protein
MKWPKEMLEPTFDLGEQVRVKGLRDPLRGVKTGKSFVGARNGDIGTVCGMSVIDEDKEFFPQVIYRVRFTSDEGSITPGLSLAHMEKVHD